MWREARRGHLVPEATAAARRTRRRALQPARRAIAARALPTNRAPPSRLPSRSQWQQWGLNLPPGRELEAINLMYATGYKDGISWANANGFPA